MQSIPNRSDRINNLKIGKNYHKGMLYAYFLKPFIESFRGIADYILIKLFIILSSMPALLTLDLFITPQYWWMGLLYLVIIDWISGIINAIYRGNFDWNVAVSKWYQVVAYIMTCGAAAVLSNTFSNIFWYFQYIVYATFFLKEFVSILQTFRMLALFRVAIKMFKNGDKTNIDGISDFAEEVEKSFDKHTDVRTPIRKSIEKALNENPDKPED